MPSTEDYPPEWHGVKLARRVYTMSWWQRHVAKNPSRVSRLNDLGFVWERLQSEWNLFMEALVCYGARYGDVLVPVSFVVPRDEDESDSDDHDESGTKPGGDGTTATMPEHGTKQETYWPKATWGFPLGNCVHRVRLRHDFLVGDHAHERRKQLDGLGFVWDVGEYRFEQFHRALRLYDGLEQREESRMTEAAVATLAMATVDGASNGSGTAGSGGSNGRTIRVPVKFVVPADPSSGWPRDLWNYPLGTKCVAVRQKELYVKNHPDRRRALDEVGFRWSGNAALVWLDVVHGAAIYSQMHGRTLNVPFDFVVPAPRSYAGEVSGKNGNDKTSAKGVGGSAASDVDYDMYESWPWPERLWGLKLGQRLKDVRLKGSYLKGADAQTRRAQLDALGFVWKPKRGRRKR